MGLRCSLLGHDYGEPFVERDREERGNEVVVTERELQECARCGAEKVTSENTEVRSMEPSPAPEDDAEAAPSGPDATSTEATESAGDSSGGAFASATEAIEQAEPDASSDATGDADLDPSVEDDAVILDDAAGEDAPGSDQWEEPPATKADAEAAAEAEAVETDDEDVEFVDAGAEDDAAAEPSADPAVESEPAADAPADAAEQASATAAEAGTGRARGEWPDHDGEDEGFDAEPGDDENTFRFANEDGEFEEDDVIEADTGFTSAGPVDQGGPDTLDFALYCPECGFERAAAGSSLRAGDICPDCRKGYLAEDR